MSYTKQEKIEALFEIRQVANEDLQMLLRADHPGENVYHRIAKERALIEDLNDLIFDELKEQALAELRRQVGTVRFWQCR
tara:strand:+ start:343 stop:582 length:240 start_codon:yes stop_codon:yes gene_type:complete